MVAAALVGFALLVWPAQRALRGEVARLQAPAHLPARPLPRPVPAQARAASQCSHAAPQGQGLVQQLNHAAPGRIRLVTH